MFLCSGLLPIATKTSEFLSAAFHDSKAGTLNAFSSVIRFDRSE